MACVGCRGGGCASNTISLRSVPKSPLVDEFDLTACSGPKASTRTAQLLRVYNLSDELGGDFRPLLQEAPGDQRPRAVGRHRLRHVGAGLPGRQEGRSFTTSAWRWTSTARRCCTPTIICSTPAWPPRETPTIRNYRGACDLYNGALESALRIVCANKELVPDTTKTINTASGAWDITCMLRGSRWQPEDFERFEFVSDYEVNGLKNLYLTHGLGVPLIAVRHQAINGRAGGGQVLSGGAEFSRHGVLAPAVEDRSRRPARSSPTINACWSCTIR